MPRGKSNKKTKDTGLPPPTKFRFQIAVSGAAAGESVEDENNLAVAEKLGEEIARRGHILVTGATTGLAYAAAIGCKRVGGLSIGVSPATSHYEHVTRYKLPDDVFDAILYTGFGYSGRNLFIIRSADAVVSVGGRIGTLNEFTIAFEEKIPIAVMVGTGGVADDIKHILRVAGAHDTDVMFHSEVDALLDDVHRVLTGKKKLKYNEYIPRPSRTTKMILKKIKKLHKPEIG